jgi:hypothetical protein
MRLDMSQSHTRPLRMLYIHSHHQRHRRSMRAFPTTFLGPNDSKYRLIVSEFLVGFLMTLQVIDFCTPIFNEAEEGVLCRRRG